MPRWRWVLTHVTRRLWFRATLIGLLGVAAAMLATVAENYIPWDLPWNIGADAVDSILAIIASSMLAVTTFSLNVMTSAYGSAANNVTPRATRLLREDPVTQNVLSTFIGSFLFSIVGIVVLKTGAYGARGRVVLFIVTIGVIALIVISLLRWIDYLTHFGQVGETTKRVEDATREAIEARLKAPSLGGAPLLDPANEIPKAAAAVAAEAIGYVEHIDMSALSRWCDEADAKLYLAINPGAFVYADTTLAWFKAKAGGGSDKEMTAAVRKAFSIGETRSFEQDPRFGLAVMSEIASRALSPAMNDPGTAIDVIGRTTRLMGLWAKGCAPEAPLEETLYPRVHVPLLTAQDLFEDAFMLIARDGAAMVEVQLRIQKALAALGRMGDEAFRAAARYQANLARDRAEAGLTLAADKMRLHEATRALGAADTRGNAIR
jgi:uncharacterized membrane protein